MTKEEIEQMMWMLQQDNLCRGDIAEHTINDEHRQMVMQNYKETEQQISELRGMLRRKEYE